MDDEQRQRMAVLRQMAWRAVLFTGPVVALAIIAGVVMRDDWTVFLWSASIGPVAIGIMLVSQWRDVRRGPYPRLPRRMMDGSKPPWVDGS